MSDITTFFDLDVMRGDWSVDFGDLKQGNDLSTSIMISLFTDGLANADDEIEDNNRRGWWADIFYDSNIGSRLWLLYRQKLTLNVARRAELYANEALQWLISDGVVSQFDITSQIIYPNSLYLQVTYYKPNGDVSTLKFNRIWEQV
ncbi:phage GP46 family protein (plasmid) [Orbus sturtevantii]|uniref:phage GP46 family protein n=1 Tax=Orbus sturtevantii TaxID=3074109 RepID=UPI00370DCB53